MFGQALLRGARALLPDGRTDDANVLIEGGRIARVGPRIDPPDGAEVVELGGLTLAPGFIDVHVHGGGGFSLITSDAGEIASYARWAVSHGVTSFLATICADTIEAGLRCAEAASSITGQIEGGAELLGVNFEGPFVSPVRRGALPASWLREPDAAVLTRLLESAPVRVMTIAPELAGAPLAVALAQERGVTVSVGHSDATYEVAKRAFGAGASHITHAFNAMRPLHHREPGPVGAALDSPGVTVEAIADGVHLHPATVGLLVRAFGADRICLVTDAVAPAGLGSGEFQIGGETARLADGSIRLPDGTIAGSAATMDAVVRNVVAWGCSGLGGALRMASAVPARVAGVAARKGAIAPDYDADLVALADDLRVAHTWVGGVQAYSA